MDEFIQGAVGRSSIGIEKSMFKLSILIIALSVTAGLAYAQSRNAGPARSSNSSKSSSIIPQKSQQIYNQQGQLENTIKPDGRILDEHGQIMGTIKLMDRQDKVSGGGLNERPYLLLFSILRWRH